MSDNTIAESEALRKHFGELALLLRGVSEWLATELYSNSLITFESLDDVVTTVGVSSLHKARTLLCALQRSFAEQRPFERADYFQRFLEILKKDQALHWLANRVEATYSKLLLCLFILMVVFVARKIVPNDNNVMRL